jgi:class 3 adenylate cyclase/DNA-binding CsgD family transcriptional regulator/tetratricopeptide (TPR) repeat protein
MDLPTGTVTFLFTDVEGSTRLVKALGATRYGDVLGTHRQLLQQVFRESGGVEVDSAGDGFFVAFRGAGHALQAAAGAQRGLARQRWPEGAVVRVRMGIHTGEASVVDEGYRGLSVHRTARICSAAHGGQVLVSSTTHDVVEADLPPDMRLRDLGLVQLPDLDRPEQLFQLVIEGLPETFPPLRAGTAPLRPHDADLLERDAELAALEALIAATPSGGRLVAIEGPAGIGKTRLLAEARARAQRAGLQVLSARGSELELEFPFGAVRQLFEPLLADAPREARAELLAGAAELATPIFDPASLLVEPDAQSSLAMLHGLFWLTANCAERQPTLLAIDDLHWCDSSSLRWLAYLLPRLEGLPLLVIVGLRPAEPGAAVHLLGRITADPLATIVRPGALSEEATGELMGAALTTEVDATFRVALHEASGGNPFFVRELANAVAEEGLGVTASDVPRLQELGGHGVTRAVSLRLSRLPAAATSLAHAVAILGDEADLRLAAALAGLKETTAADAATALSRIEIFRRDASLAFVHPVVRTAVYAELSAVEKDRGHARAARLLAEADAEPERVAAQLLVAPVADDEWATSTLRDAARSALGRGAPDSAAAYLRRALEEPSPPEPEAILHELGTAEARMADPEAIEHLAAARAAAGDLRARSRIALDLGSALFTAGRAREALETLEEAITELAGEAPELTRELEYLLIGVARFEPELYPRAQERLERLRELAPQLGPGDEVGLANLASEAARATLERSEAVELAERALAGGALMRGDPYPAFLYAVGALMTAEHFDAAVRHCTGAIEEAQRRGLVMQFCFASLYRARVSLLRGSLADAIADAQLSLDAIDSYGLEVGRPNTVAVLSQALLDRGDADEARTLVHAAGVGTTMETYAQTGLFEVRARLRLADDDPAGALDELVELGRFLVPLGIRNPALSSWRSLAALASLGLDRRDDALRFAHMDLDLARQWGSPRALGESLVAAGLAEGGGEGRALLQEAVAVLEPSEARLEHARAMVELGSALRRSNRRSDAREPLRLGRELATLCGAKPLAERAGAELLATGARPRRIALSGVESLTPSERRVAQMAAEGSTNRQIAQDLFVTTKTVEVHLSSVYRKLDIASRTQLAAALAGAPAAENQAGES